MLNDSLLNDAKTILQVQTSPRNILNNSVGWFLFLCFIPSTDQISPLINLLALYTGLKLQTRPHRLVLGGGGGGGGGVLFSATSGMGGVGGHFGECGQGAYWNEFFSCV